MEAWGYTGPTAIFVRLTARLSKKQFKELWTRLAYSTAHPQPLAMGPASYAVISKLVAYVHAGCYMSGRRACNIN